MNFFMNVYVNEVMTTIMLIWLHIYAMWKNEMLNVKW
jgi:hypothetical protein